MSHQQLFTPEHGKELTQRYATLIDAANRAGWGYLFDPDFNQRLTAHFDALRKIQGEFRVTAGSAFELTEDLQGELNDGIQQNNP